MKIRLCLFLFVFAGISDLVTAADTDKIDINDELKRFEGTWELLTAESEGKDVTNKALERKSWVRFKGDSWLADRYGRPAYTAQNSRIRLDPSKSPKTFDHIVTRTVGGKTYTFVYPGIYEIDGDSLKLCYDTDLKNRPNDFKAKAGTKHFFATLKRVKSGN